MTAPALVVVHPDKQAVADAGAARLVTALLDAQAQGRAPHVSLTGGSLGSAIIASLLELPAHTAVDWSTVSIWWGDERYLPAGDPDRNDTQNDAAGLDRLGLDQANVHRVPGPDASESAEESAARYSSTVRGSGGGEFDVMILGVGPDGHVASLFPGHPAQLTTDAIAVAVHDSPKPPPDRVSLTFECLSRSDRVWFLVAGADKAEAVRNGVAGAGPELSSAAQVHGIRETLWLVDADSASDLPD
ncbi:6-phosphogluconolactonase [Pedococcus bigeumensis]|uniref:6-phosphogluconolactonase n=1 Tax=Pedococcus bigeumensis TaxID=433644 RepID=A0A502CZD8_9MICO|nr:6-phosphogluconolactonase [Pedococcus bigeumensis]TPG17890.1 6-phosphogluconolactonase [Pedococcus bigeumensis]